MTTEEINGVKTTTNGKHANGANGVVDKGDKKAGNVAAFGAEGKKDLLMMDPDKLVLVTKKGEALFDLRVLRKVNPELLESIAAVGVKTPLHARKGEDANGNATLEVVDGRQRTIAAREVNRIRRAEGTIPISIPVLVVKGSDNAMMELAALANAIRTEDNPIERATNMAAMQERGISDKRIALAYGIQAQTVTQTVALLELAKEVQDAVAGGIVGLYFAVTELGKLPKKEQGRRLAELIEAGATRGAEAKDAISKLKAGEKLKKGGKGRTEGEESEGGGGDGEEKATRSKARSRVFLTKFESRLKKSKLNDLAAFARFIMGDDKALRGPDFENVREAAREAGWKG